MSRRIAALVVATVLLVSASAPLALASPAGQALTSSVGDGVVAQTDGGSTDGTATNDTTAETKNDDEPIPPGQKLAGAISVQESETDGVIERRAFENRMANANSNASKAGVVAEQVESVRERLTELKERRDRLKAKHDDGTISDRAYRVQITRVVSEIEQVKSLLNQTADAAETVPESDLQAKGVNTTALDTLRSNASELTGPEVAEIARSIAGENPGKGLDKAEEKRKNGNRGESNGSDAGDGNAADDNPGEGGDSAGDSPKSKPGDGSNNGPDTPPGQDNRAKDAETGGSSDSGSGDDTTGSNSTGGSTGSADDGDSTTEESTNTTETTTDDATGA
ncbi:hypothetical protein ACH9L7_15320 [Haloferax sp. S1W]|uniref:DUF7096 domain-containing protein n=1 Tax=Haloferax sp. S1W TaxID=3377110 RepID=UPI0037C57054